MADDWRTAPDTYAAEHEAAATTPRPTRWEQAEATGATDADLKD